MSCPHGNHPDACDICDEVAAEYRIGVEHTEREWVGLTANELEFWSGELGQGELGTGVLRAVVDYLKKKNT